MLQLGTAKRSIDIRHTVVITDMVVFELPAMRYFGLGSKMFGKCPQVLVHKQQHAAAARGDGLVAVETQGPHLAEETGMSAFIFAANAFGSILNQFDMPFCADFGQLLNTDGMSKSMHGDAGLDAPACLLVIAMAVLDLAVSGKPGLYRIRRKPHRGLVYVDENRVGPKITDGIAGSYECQCLRQDFIAALYTTQQHGHMQRVRSAYTNHRPSGACICGHVCFKAVYEWPYGTHECRVNALLQIFLLIADELRHGQGDEFRIYVQTFNEVDNVLIHRI